MGRLFDTILDIIIATTSMIVQLPRMIYYFPYTISLIYRFQNIWFPYIYETIEVSHVSNIYYQDEEKKLWLNENIGKYRWKLIKRGGVDHSSFQRRPSYSLCFRHKSDAMAYKLKWVE